MVFLNIFRLLSHYIKDLLLNQNQRSENPLIFYSIKILILLNILNFLFLQNIYAIAPAQDTSITTLKKDSVDTILGTLSGLTCETQGIGNLLRSEFSHTCIPASLLTLAIAQITSPGLAVAAMLRLKINDHDLFGAGFPGGQCAQNNKLDPKSPKLTFALCNNIELAKTKAVALLKSNIAIVKAVFTGEDPWDSITDIWNTYKSDYHIIYKDQEDGARGRMMDVPLPIYWHVVRDNDRMCVMVPTLLGGAVEIGCKYIREPYPDSIYSRFIDVNATSSPNISKTSANDPMALVNCSMFRTDHYNNGSCYQRAYNNSKSAIVITSPLIECIKETISRLLISNNVCTLDDINQVVNLAKHETSVLFQFQRNMHRIVTGLLTLYVIFFGLKIVLAGQVPPRAELINFILKMLFVTYFSVGININPNSNSDSKRLDGMTQFALPLLLGGINELASWVINASPSGLCKFNGADIHYNNKAAHLALWDSLDCRISHYLGLDVLSTLLAENQYRKGDWKNFDFFSFPVPPYFYLLIPAIMSGQITLVGLALSYPLLIISIGAFMVNATVMCIISIAILAILAPLFVPMFLFKYTRGYFEAWVKLLISFLLQPMVITVFMITMFSVYDLGFYGHCKYISSKIGRTVESTLIGDNGGERDIRIFFVDNDWSKYSQEDAKSCQTSLGYMLNNSLTTVFNIVKDSINIKIEDINKLEKPGDDTDRLKSSLGVVMESGMFFFSPKVLFEKVKDLVLALLTACFTLYLMYHLSDQLAQFAANITEGATLKNVTIHPQAIYKAGMAAVAMVGQMAAGSASKVAGRAGGAKDQKLKDQISSGDDNKSEDSVSTDS